MNALELLSLAARQPRRAVAWNLANGSCRYVECAACVYEQATAYANPDTADYCVSTAAIQPRTERSNSQCSECGKQMDYYDERA